MDNKERAEKVWVEEVEFSGGDLVEQVKGLIRQGNVRRLIIRNSKGELLLEMPLTAGVAVGGALTIVAPVAVVLAAVTALAINVKIQVVRAADADQGNTSETQA